MIKNKINFSATLLLALTWLPGSLGAFSEEEVRRATVLLKDSVSYGDEPKYQQIDTAEVFQIVIRNHPNLNGFAISMHFLEQATERMKLPDQAALQLIAEIKTKEEGKYDYFALLPQEKKFIILFYEVDPESEKKYSSLESLKIDGLPKSESESEIKSASSNKVRLSNEIGSIDVDALPIEETYENGKDRLSVLVELGEWSTLLGKGTVTATSPDTVISYMFYNPTTMDAANPDMTVDKIAFTLYVKSANQISNRNYWKLIPRCNIV